MTPIAIVTGSGGLIGSESVRHFAGLGFDVIGLENDMRARFFGPESSTEPRHRAALHARSTASARCRLDIRDTDGVERVFAEHGRRIELIVHTAAQPSHDWAASDPQTDFTVNANGTLNLLEAARDHCPDAPFVFTSTNKVYGDRPNFLPLIETETRLELPEDHHGTAASAPTCRSTTARTRCSASRRSPPTCSCRSTGATSGCRPSASAAAA